MSRHPSYADLTHQIEALNLEFKRLKAAEKVFHRQNESLKALHETSLALIDILDKEELLENILHRAGSLTSTLHGFIYLLMPDERQMEMKMGMGFFESQLGRKVSPGEGVGGYAWKSREPTVVENYQLWNSRIPDKVLDGLRSIVGIPLKSEHHVMGVMGLAHVEKEKQFNPEDVATLERFAALAVIALEKSNLYANVRHELAERKKTEAFWRESENRYRTFLESSPDPIVVYDMKGVATYVNPAFEQTFGLSRSELLGKQIDFVPPEALAETRAAIKRMLSGQKIHLFETKRSTKDGKILDVQLSSTLYQDQEGQPLGNIVTLRDISPQKKVEKELGHYRNQLEKLVQERTSELELANTQLAQEIEDRKKAEKALRKREKELQSQSDHLEEVNTALRILLKQRDDDKKELGNIVIRNVEELVTPYLHRFIHGRLSTEQKTLAKILETNISNIISPFTDKLASGLSRLTPVEIRVASLVKEGMTNKEIAEILLVSKNTVLFHRHNIRKKLGLKNKKINLRSHLLSVEK